MFTTLLITSSPARCESLNRLAVECGKLSIPRATNGYPAILWLGSACRQYEPELVFLDLECPASAMACLREVQSRCPQTPVIGVGGMAAQQETFRASGIAQFLVYPPKREALEAAIATVIRSQHQQPIPNLFCFLPAKAGSGASTIALSTAAALAASTEQRVLCLEADLHSGMMGEMAGVPARGSTQSVLAYASEIDPLRWHNFISRRHGVDFLLASAERHHQPPEWTQYFQLLRFLKTRYETIVVDLPDLIDTATEEILRRAHTVFLVATQEPCALQLAKRRILELSVRGLPADRIQVVMNAWNRFDISLEDVRKYLGCHIAARIPEDQRGVRAAMAEYQLALPAALAPGRAIRRFAEGLAAGCAAQMAGEDERRWAGLRRLLTLSA